MTIFLLIVGGFALLVLGGEMLVGGAVAVAKRFGVSPLVIGLTLVGFGTSTPELVTSLQAALVGSPGIAVGNVVGSNIANILLILGLATLIRPVSADPTAFRRDGGTLAIATALCLYLALSGAVSRGEGVVLILALAAYLFVTFAFGRADEPVAAPKEFGAQISPSGERGAIWAAASFIFGVALTIGGAHLLVSGAIDLARMLEVSETLIGLTIVAVGTSLPELATSVIAALKGESDVAFGNIVGSNVFNILGILGTTAIVSPLPIPASIASFDVWVMVGATIALLLAVATGRRVSRFEGGVLFAAYVGYLAMLAA